MFYSRSVLAAVALAACTLAAPITPRQDQNQGQPISVGIAANRSAPAVDVFGTTTDSPNFLQLPTGLCIVPMYANQAGINKDGPPKLLIVQQALEICPRAQRIVVSTV